MRFHAPARVAGPRGHRRTSFVRRALAGALLLLAARAADAAAQVPDTFRIVNVARAAWTDGDGIAATATAEATVGIFRAPGVALAPPRQGTIHPGGVRAFAHRLENTGNGLDRFTLLASVPAGWAATVYLDANGDGVPDGGDAVVDGPVALASGASAALLLVVTAPADAAEGEVVVELRATSGFAESVTAAVEDRLTVRHPAPALRLEKTVDRTEAARGDTLAYALSWANDGDGPAPAAALADTLPAGLRLVAGSLRLGAAALTDAADADAGTVSRTADGRDVVRIELGTVAAGDAGTAAFRAVVAADAAAALANVAVLTGGGEPTRSAPATTGVGSPLLELEKVRLGADTVDAGGEVRYRLAVANRSAALTARDLVVTDTLPAELAYRSASRTVEVDGQVVRWRVGTLLPGQSAELELVARVVAETVDAEIVNRARLRASNAADADAAAEPLHVRGFLGNELELRKQAGVMEAALGEAVPYVVTLRNTGGLPLRGIVVHDRLPEGVRLVERGIAGADSVRAEGRDVRFFVAGPLAGGAEHRILYSVAVVSAPAGGVLENRAAATAEGERVRSDTAVARVRLRGSPMASRVVLGKVWLDLDGDGRQGPGEPGVRGAEVWSADGEMATTDGEGRFSFPEVRAGSQVVRLDAGSLPAGMRLAAATDGVQRVRVDGWTTPVLSFRVVPASAAAEAAAAPVGEAPAPAEAPLPRIAALRTDEEREAEAARAFAEGPGVRIVAPADGTVIPGNRLFVGLLGEPGAEARLYDGDRLVGEAVLRPDGSADFVAVEVAPGTSHLRAWMRSSWGRERWDSVAVHRSGAPARLEGPSAPVVLRAEGRAVVPVHLRVLDEWGVPVTGRPSASAEVRGARLGAADADSAALGWQGTTGADGTLAVPLRGGPEVGTGTLEVRVGRARTVVPVTVLPTDRPLLATGTVQVGVGAAPDAFGAVTVRGSLGGETAVTLSYDSRRGEGESEFFGRGVDLRDEGRYPTLGDGSERRAFGSATQALSARIERGLDWAEVGDVETGGFSGSERLGGYRRAITGAAARVGTGPLTWRAFGSFTDQALRQDQLRANGTSGPYRFGGAVRPGTERLAIEVRARDNAARLVRREELVRSADYQIDYLTGEVLLQRPLPSEDAFGNPVYLVALLERRSGEREVVGGVRLELDALRMAGAGAAGDSLGLAVFGVHDGAGSGLPGSGAARLGGAELLVRRGGLSAVGEVLHSDHADSTSLAGQARLAWALAEDRVRLEAGWLRVGDGFSATLNPRLRSGLEEISLGTQVALGEGARLRLRHERQRFRAFGVERQSTMAGVERSVGGRQVTAEGGVQSDETARGGASAALARATVDLGRGADAWVEGQRALSHDGSGTPRPDLVGFGGGYRVLPFARVEGSRRWVRLDRDSASYSVTGMMVRSELPLGARIWSGLERTEAQSTSHAAVLGWNQRLAAFGGWEFHTLLERRMGVDRAPVADPVRGLPFPQAEPDRWSAAWGLEYLPPAGPRFAARQEVRGGASQGWRFDLNAEVPAGRSAALLTRHDWWSESRAVPGGGATRRDRSLLGLALRPAGAGTVNALAKVEYRHAMNPLGGAVLAGSQEEWRLIGATDAVWTPLPGFELAGRYALRRTVAEDSSGGAFGLRSTGHFVGGRVERALFRRVAGRLDGRLLSEGVTGESRWSAAPSLTVQLGGGLEAEGGYRFGDLLDPDFAAFGRNGAFALLSLRFTEGSVRDAASFWRGRLAAEP